MKWMEASIGRSKKPKLPESEETDSEGSVASADKNQQPKKCKFPDVTAPMSKQDHKKPKLCKEAAPSEDNAKRRKLEKPKETMIPGDDALAHLIAGFLATQFSSADQDTVNMRTMLKHRFSLLSHSKFEEVKAIWRISEEQFMRFEIEYQMQLKKQQIIIASKIMKFLKGT